MIMKFSRRIALLAFAMPLMSVAASADPVVTPAPDPAHARIQERATTSFYSFVTTPIPQDDHSIGMGLQREGTDEYCKLPSPPQR